MTFEHNVETTNFNVVKEFPIFLPYSAGSYQDKATLTIQAINQIFPFLKSLCRLINNKELIINNIEDLSLIEKNYLSSIALKKLFDKYGSDKANQHNYHHLYGSILNEPNKITNIFEIGLGTNNIDVVSNMGEYGKPGASLRAFREYCPFAFVFGGDIDRRILFNEERINTFFIDQTKPETFDSVLTNIPTGFDLVIDDGLHSPNANVASIEFGLKLLKIGGWMVVEDIGEPAIVIWQVVSSLLSNSYEPHLFYANGSYIFAVKKVS
jgi:hypothetical protein